MSLTILRLVSYLVSPSTSSVSIRSGCTALGQGEDGGQSYGQDYSASRVPRRSWRCRKVSQSFKSTVGGLQEGVEEALRVNVSYFKSQLDPGMCRRKGLGQT